MKKLFICDERMVDSNRDQWVITDLVEMIELILNQQHNEEHTLYEEVFQDIKLDMERTIYSFDINEDDTLLVSKLLTYLNNLDVNINYRLA